MLTVHTCQSASGCDRTDTVNSNPTYPSCGQWFCESHEHPEWTVIGYDTTERNLPLFKVSNIYRLSPKDLQDAVAANGAVRRTHIIYTVVRTSDLWW